MTRARIIAWLQQPTTIAGLAALVGDAVVVATGAATWRFELPLALGSLVAVLMPDNTTASTLVIKTLRDVLAALASKDAATISVAVADAQALLSAITTAAPLPLRIERDVPEIAATNVLPWAASSAV